MSAYSIIALGDSITYGYPFGQKYSWVELLSQKIHNPITNIGINGDTLRHMYNRLIHDVVDVKSDYVILLGGSNDICQGCPEKWMEENLTKILKTLAEYKIRTILALPPPIRNTELEKQLKSFRLFIKKTAKTKRLPVINFYDDFFNSAKRINPQLIEDGLHPTIEGYEVMAERAFKSMQKILK